MKGNAEKIVEYGEKSLDLKKDNLMALLIVAYAMPAPQYINQHRAEEDKINSPKRRVLPGCAQSR